MGTSKNYYEMVMRDFEMYTRGRTLEQYCCNDTVDYSWLVKIQSQNGNPDKSQKGKVSRHYNYRVLLSVDS